MPTIEAADLAQLFLCEADADHTGAGAPKLGFIHVVRVQLANQRRLGADPIALLGAAVRLALAAQDAAGRAQ